MNALFEDCFGNWEPEEPIAPCFEYAFPLTVAFPDGTTTTTNNYEELDAIYVEWFENNPDATEFPNLVYPFNLQMEDGSVVTVNNDDELTTIFNDCYGGGGDPGDGGFEECFTFNYPLTIVFPDGSAPAINSDDELWTAVFDFYENNPDSEDDPTFQYPISVTLTADGTVATVNNDDELNAIFEGCFDCVVSNGEGLVLGGKQAMAAKVAVKQHTKIKSHTKHNLSKMMAKKAASAKRF
jgi:hypothetical protein